MNISEEDVKLYEWQRKGFTVMSVEEFYGKELVEFRSVLKELYEWYRNGFTAMSVEEFYNSPDGGIVAFRKAMLELPNNFDIGRL